MRFVGKKKKNFFQANMCIALSRFFLVYLSYSSHHACVRAYVRAYVCTYTRTRPTYVHSQALPSTGNAIMQRE